MTIQLTLAQARQSWCTRQRLVGAEPGRRSRPLLDLVAEIGWMPITSAVTPYLALFARGALATRAELDDAACRRGELSLVPGPRGSTWMVPVAEAPLARAFAVADHASREARVAAATPLTSRDLSATRDALRTALATPASAEELRARMPADALRSLGEVGRRNGVPTLAALVLRSLWVNGEVARISADGRLDGPLVRWAIDPRPRTVPAAADAVDTLASRWLAAHAPLSPRAFAAAFGIAAGRANAAFKPLRPQEVQVEGLDGAFLVPADFTPPELRPLPPRLLPLRDPLTDVQLAAQTLPATARAALARAGGAAPTVLVDGEVVGTWQYDDVARVITWRQVGPPPLAEATDAVAREAARVAAFIAGELGGAPLHTPPAPRPRASAAARGDDLAIEV